MECNHTTTTTTLFLVSVCWVLLIPVSHSAPSDDHRPSQQNNNNHQYVTSTTPPVLIPRLETWARAMQLSFRSISEPPMQSQFPSTIGTIQYQTADSLLPTLLPESTTVAPFLDGNSHVLKNTMNSIAWLIKLGSIQAQRLSGNPKLDEAEILQICKDSYDNASSNLQEAMKALASKNAKRMNTMLNAVLSNIGECRDEYFGKRSPLATYEDKVTKMTNNCLIVLHLTDEHR